MRTLLAATSALIFALSSASAGDTVNRWGGMSSPGFTRCAAESQCLGQTPCDTDSVNITGGCLAECVDLSAEVPCNAFASCRPGWDIFGFAGHFPCPGDVPVGTGGAVSGQRLSASSFEINTFISQTGITEKIVEISLFRFAGDPTVFNREDLWSVSDLVDLGFISAADVLFVTEIEAGDISALVDVTGIPDDELVLFATGDGPFPSDTGCEPVPALGSWVFVGLVGVMMVLSGVYLRRRSWVG